MDGRLGNADIAAQARLLDELLGAEAKRCVARHIERLLIAGRDPGAWPAVYRAIKRLSEAGAGAATAQPGWPSDVAVRRG